ncbi:hypothetical protein C481_20616 [Natrialba asiatica DSM 12278]|uniref:Uncharacterized protein n=1 Tax=Natrialba asiatica (strain ATCC 700177 / DSM 12278 / JCM 9576 / FERM P-10747 / NBRC 102637 / 172P1) TaxID=29540 RepID=M0AF84_NATA1|nr:hypothetical protein C481_20616 [Natrialba asiatica DSM 12278]
MTGSDQFGNAIQKCDECDEETCNLRPVCVAGRDEIPSLCPSCYRDLEGDGLIDRERDAEVFGYAE